MTKFYTVDKEINGKVYKAQFNGISASLDAMDRSYIDGTTNTSMLKLSNYLLANVIVQPKGLTPDDFDSIDEFNEVIAFASGVMRGEFREAKNESGTNKKGKE